MGIITMSNAFKKVLVVIVTLCLLLSFAACGKDDDTGSNPSSSVKDYTQDFDDEWGELDGNDAVQDEAIKDLWEDGVNSNSAVVVDPTESESTESDKTESDNPSNTTSSNEEGTVSEGEFEAETPEDVDAIF